MKRRILNRVMGGRVEKLIYGAECDQARLPRRAGSGIEYDDTVN